MAVFYRGLPVWLRGMDLIGLLFEERDLEMSTRHEKQLRIWHRTASVPGFLFRRGGKSRGAPTAVAGRYFCLPLKLVDNRQEAPKRQTHRAPSSCAEQGHSSGSALTSSCRWRLLEHRGGSQTQSSARSHYSVAYCLRPSSLRILHAQGEKWARARLFWFKGTVFGHGNGRRGLRPLR